MNTKEIRVGVLGAYGSAGRAVIRELLHRRVEHIVAAGRNPAKMDGLLIDLPPDTVSVVLGELDDPGMRDALFGSIDVLINCVGPYIEHGLQVARSAISAGVHYIDISAEQEHYRRLKELDPEARRRNLIIAPGFGLYPGLSSLFLLDLLQRLPGASHCRMSLIMEGEAAEEVGTASFAGGLLELCYPLELIRHGTLKSVFPGGRRAVTLPEITEVKKTMLWPQLEILSLKDICSFSSFETSVKIGAASGLSPLSVSLIKLLQPHRHPRVYRLLKRLTAVSMKQSGETRNPGKMSGKRSGALPGTLPGTIVHIELETDGDGISGTLIGHSQRSTAWLPVQTALTAPDLNVSGVLHPGGLFQWNEVYSQLHGAGEIETVLS